MNVQGNDNQLVAQYQIFREGAKTAQEDGGGGFFNITITGLSVLTTVGICALKYF
jgi:hypothetical protein